MDGGGAADVFRKDRLFSFSFRVAVVCAAAPAGRILWAVGGPIKDMKAHNSSPSPPNLSVWHDRQHKQWHIKSKCGRRITNPRTERSEVWASRAYHACGAKNEAFDCTYFA